MRPLRSPLQKYLCGNHPRVCPLLLPLRSAVRAVRVERHDRHVGVRGRRCLRRVGSNASGANRLVRRGRARLVAEVERSWLARGERRGRGARRKVKSGDRSTERTNEPTKLSDVTLMTLSLSHISLSLLSPSLVLH